MGSAWCLESSGVLGGAWQSCSALFQHNLASTCPQCHSHNPSLLWCHKKCFQSNLGTLCVHCVGVLVSRTVHVFCQRKRLQNHPLLGKNKEVWFCAWKVPEWDLIAKRHVFEEFLQACHLQASRRLDGHTFLFVSWHRQLHGESVVHYFGRDWADRDPHVLIMWRFHVQVEVLDIQSHKSGVWCGNHMVKQHFCSG